MTVLRWVAVVPGALLAALAAYYAVGFGSRLTMIFVGIDVDGDLVQTGTGMLMGFAFVFSIGYAGAWIAPSRKPATALTLTVLTAILAVSRLLIAFPTIDQPMALGDAIATPIGAFYVLVRTWRGEDIWGR